MERLTRLSLAHPLFVCGALLAVTAALAAQLPRLRSETGYRAYLGASHPSVERLDHFIDGFGGGLPMAAVWRCDASAPCTSVFDDDALEMAGTVARALEDHEHVRRVESPATTRLLIARADVLETRTLLEGSSVPPDRDALAARAVLDPFWKGILVSQDRKVGSILLELASSDSDASKSVLAALEQALRPFQARGYHFYIVGQTAQFALTDEALAADSQRLTPIMIGLVALVVFLLFRSWQTVLGSLLTVGFATVWTLGSLALLGWPRNAITETIPPLILVIALCDAIHLLARYSQHRAALASSSRDDRRRAIVRAAADAGPACLATTLTTVAGFLSFTSSGLASFVRFGTVSAIGIAAALLLTFTLLPVLMVLLPADRIRAVRASETWDRALSALVFGIRRRARPIAGGAAALALVSLVGALRLQVDVDEYELYGEQSEVVRGFRFLEKYLHRPDSLELEIVLPEGVPLNGPDTLAAVTTLSSRLDQIVGLGPVRSILDAIAWTNRLLHYDDPYHQRLGETAAENAELLTLLAIKDPAGLDHWVSQNFRRLRLSIEAEKRPRSERGAILEQVKQALADSLPENWETTLTGSFVVYQDMTNEIQRTQLSSFATATLVVFVVLIAFLRHLGGSLRSAGTWAAVGMFPTILPVIVTFGVMGFLGIRLDMGTAMVAAIIIGIAVDDTIHLLGQFYRRRLAGTGPVAAIEGAVVHVGQAVLTTSIALTMGFFILVLSSWQSISSFGFLSGVAILGALAADLWLLPALVLLIADRGTPARSRESPDSEKPPLRAQRVAMSAVALFPFLAVTVAALFGALDTASDRLLACRTMPNGVVPVIAAGASQCRLHHLDRVLSLHTGSEQISAANRPSFLSAIATAHSPALLEIDRSGKRLRVEVPILESSRRDRLLRLGAVSLGMSALLLYALGAYWRSSAAAAPAILLLVSALGAGIISIVSANDDALLAVVSTPVAPLIAASLVHLALTYPTSRAIVRIVPRIVWVPYLVAAVLGGLELRGIAGEATFWSLSQGFTSIMACAAAAVVWLGALTAARRAPSLLERARGRLCLAASSGVPLLFGAMYLGWGERVPGGPLTPLLAGITILVLPIGYAVTRYDLFDVAPDARRLLDRALQYGAIGLFTAAIVALLDASLGARGPLGWAIAGMLGHRSGRWLHSSVQRLVEHRIAPASELRRRLLGDHQQLSAELVAEDISAKLIGRTLEAGLDATGVAVFLEDATGWRPVYAGRQSPAFAVSYAITAASILSGGHWVHLARGDIPDSSGARLLRSAGVELVASITADRERVGILLVGRSASDRAYSSEELQFVRSAAGHAALAIHNARLSSARIGAERRAVFGRLVSEVAHDLGSPLRAIEHRSLRLLERAGDPAEVRLQAQKIQEVSAYLISTVYDLVGDADREREGISLGATVEEIVDRAIAANDLNIDRERVLVSVPPGLPRIPEADKIVRVLANLIDNALAASAREDCVWVYATAEPGEIRIDVQDRGVGMNGQSLRNAFDLYYTTKALQGGSGVGLSISQEIVTSLGGKVELFSEEGEGTMATVRLPVPE